MSRLSTDVIDSYKRQIADLNQMLDLKDDQVMELHGKIANLNEYAQSLKSEVERLYSKEGKVLPEDLANAPSNLSQDMQKLISEE